MATRIYTKTGDDGTTGLFGGTRVSKADARIEAYGTVDELNAVLAVALTCDMRSDVRECLLKVSAELFTLGADLATPLDPPPSYNIPRIQEENISALEGWIDELDKELEPLKAFILPGGSAAAAYLHLARTVCRRAERRTVLLSVHEDVGGYVVCYLNRLSDYLFTAARAVNHAAGIADIPWRP